MEDRVPTVTQDDIDRLLRREFPDHRMYQAKAVLRLYAGRPDAIEPLRMQAALLKVAEGSVEKLREMVAVAQDDFRNVLAPAEYARWFRRIQRGETEEPDEETRRADWEEYQAWFTGREEAAGGGPATASVAATETTEKEEIPMEIKTPKVTEDDLERLLQRDFAPEEVQKARTLLRVYGYGKAKDGGTYRVQAAILKVAEGAVDKLPDLVAEARSDFRNVIVAAETPASFRLSLKASPEEENAAHRADWEQYQAWFTRGPGGP